MFRCERTFAVRLGEAVSKAGRFGADDEKPVHLPHHDDESCGLCEQCRE